MNTRHDPKLSRPYHSALMIELAPIIILTFEHFQNNVYVDFIHRLNSEELFFPVDAESHDIKILIRFPGNLILEISREREPPLVVTFKGCW